MASFWAGFRGKDALESSMEEERERLKVLRNAIGLYRFALGSLPSRLEDLCFNTRGVAGWGTGFFRWCGPGTFTDSFGHAYQYSCENDTYILRSPGLDIATSKRCPSSKGALLSEA